MNVHVNDIFKSVYVINLASRPDQMTRWANVGFKYTRLNAVCPNDLPRLGLSPMNPRFAGWMCASLSHRQCHETGPWPMLIFEDDVQIVHNVIPNWPPPNEWSCVAFTPFLHDAKHRVERDWFRIYRFGCLQAYAVTERASHTFLKLVSKWNCFSVDDALSNAGFGFMERVYTTSGFAKESSVGPSNTKPDDAGGFWRSIERWRHERVCMDCKDLR